MSSTPPKSLRVTPGAYMQAGDRGGFWRYYDDQTRMVRLAAAPSPGGLVAFNTKLSRYLVSPLDQSDLPVLSFFPAALMGGVNGAVTVEALSTGGRSFLLPPDSAASLGLPSHLLLDLAALGWGSGALELRFEVKGAGTSFERTRIDASHLDSILESRPQLARSYAAARSGGGPPPFFSSLAMYESRNMGGQREDYAVHSTRASQMALGTSEVRFVPTLLGVVAPESLQENLRFVSRACAPDEALYAGRVANELRCTPSTIRAVYFDRAGSDEKLKQLCRRVSAELDDLEATAHELASDVRRYFEHIAQSTQFRFDPRHVVDREIYTWMQFGDIWVTFERDESGKYRNAEEYRHERRVAWYLAKDEVIVPRLGRLFVDMECLRSTQAALSDQELEFQHALYILNVLRDHNRVATQFRIGAALLDTRYLSYADRVRIHRRVLSEMQDSVNRSPWVGMDVREQEIVVEIAYRNISGARSRFVVPRRQIAEIYD